MGKWAVWLLLLSSCTLADEPLYERLKSAAPPSKTAAIEQSESADDSLPIGRADYLPHTIIINETIPGRYREITEDTLYLQLVMLSAIGVLALMPESVTGWNEEELAARSLESRWKENVSTRPVWDRDDPFINYVGHPVSGAWYYTMARNDGLSVTESALFSALMSTLVWEYGYEAFAEVPSIQDLIVTPLAGSLLGEWFYTLERRLDANGGIVFGSRVMGNISYFLLDPLGRIAGGMEELLRRSGLSPEVTMSLRTYPYQRGMTPSERPRLHEELRPMLGDYGIIITIY